jgi:hypothetical protein
MKITLIMALIYLAGCKLPQSNQQRAEAAVRQYAHLDHHAKEIFTKLERDSKSGYTIGLVVPRMNWGGGKIWFNLDASFHVTSEVIN